MAALVLDNLFGGSRLDFSEPGAAASLHLDAVTRLLVCFTDHDPAFVELCRLLVVLATMQPAATSAVADEARTVCISGITAAVPSYFPLLLLCALSACVCHDHTVLLEFVVTGDEDGGFLALFTTLLKAVCATLTRPECTGAGAVVHTAWATSGAFQDVLGDVSGRAC